MSTTLSLPIRLSPLPPVAPRRSLTLAGVLMVLLPGVCLAAAAAPVAPGRTDYDGIAKLVGVILAGFGGIAATYVRATESRTELGRLRQQVHDLAGGQRSNARRLDLADLTQLDPKVAAVAAALLLKVAADAAERLTRHPQPTGPAAAPEA
jgi:hypothetical protein